MTTISIIGILAACLTTGAYIPQAIKTIRSNSTHDLSISTFSMLFVGTILWWIYGINLHDIPLILANTITAMLAGVILYMKIKSMSRGAD